jgi:hypothetical protein
MKVNVAPKIRKSETSTSALKKHHSFRYHDTKNSELSNNDKRPPMVSRIEVKEGGDLLQGSSGKTLPG